MKRITCSGCSLLCNDIYINTDGIYIDRVIGACKKGKERFDQQTAKNRLTAPLIRNDNEVKNLTLDEALENVKQILNNSSKPILYGFSTSSCEAQLKGIELAKKINGFIDSNSIICQGKVLNIAKETSLTLTTLTEVINKADVIILWGANAVESIPRLINKILFSRGKFRMTGREIKTIIIIDPVKTASFGVMQIRDIALNIIAGKDIELIRLLKDLCCNDNEIPKNGVAGIEKDEIRRLLLNIIGAENGVIFVGQGLLMSNPEVGVIKELLDLVELINQKQEKGRMSLILLGGHYNMLGFEHVALSISGKNHSLQFQDNNLIKTDDTIISKIKNNDFDCSIIVGTDPISHLPIELSKKLSSKPIIVLDNRKSATTDLADVVLPTAITGIECDGLVYRIDHVPIQLKKVLNPPSGVLSDEDILNKIIQLIK